MACIRCTARKSVIPFLPSRLAEHPLCRMVSGQSSHLERLHRPLHEEQERRRQEQEQDQEQRHSSPSPQQEVESERLSSPAPQPKMPPTPPQGIPAAGGDPNEDKDDDAGHPGPPVSAQTLWRWVRSVSTLSPSLADTPWPACQRSPARACAPSSSDQISAVGF
jgi:hypothetical protein